MTGTDVKLVVQGNTDDCIAYAMQSLFDRARGGNPRLRRLRPGLGARLAGRRLDAKRGTHLCIEWFWTQSANVPRNRWRKECLKYVRASYGLDLISVLTIIRLLAELVFLFLQWLDSEESVGYLAANASRMQGSHAQGPVQGR